MDGSRAARLVLLNAAIAAAYAGLAWAVSFLSTGPMGVVPFWPAAGLAVAVAIRMQWRVLPGVWLGSFSYQLHAFAGDTTFQTLLNAGLPALGSCAQAWIGGELVRRRVGAGAPLSDGLSVVKFLVFVGPLSCLVASTFGTIVLWALGNIQFHETPSVWMNWWAGDSLGAVVAGPIVHLWLTHARRRVWKRALIVSLPALGAAAAALFGFFSVRNREADAMQATFEKEAAALARGVQNDLHGYEVVLESLRAYFQTVGAVSRLQFSNFAETIVAQDPGIQALSWSPVVPEGEGPAWVSRAVADGVEDFVWKARDEAGNTVPIEDPGLSPVIYYIEPVEKNAQALGFAIRTNPSAWSAIEKAIEAGVPRATERVRLVQETGEDWGIVVYAPLYEGLVVLDDPDARGMLFRGAVSIVLRTENFLRHAISGSTGGSNFDVHLADLDAPEGESELAAITHEDSSSHSDEFAYVVDDLRFGGRRWSLAFHGTPVLEEGRAFENSLLVLTGGMMFTGVLTAFMLLVTGHTERITELVEQRTEELRREIEDRGSAEKAAQAARVQAENANAAKSRFLAAVSHEIRTPINAIIGMSELLAGSQLPPEQKDFADTIMRAGNGLLAIVNDILDLARIEAGRMDLRSEPFGPVHLMEELHALFTLRAANRGIGLRFEIDPSLPAAVKGDSARVRQVLINLIGNAVKFTPHGEVVVGAAVATGGSDRVLLRFDVRDTGPGISPEDLPRLFQPFMQIRGDATQEGTGLGLAICSQLISLMKGGMAVESLEGEGTRFTVTIPFAVCTPAEASDSFDDSSHDVDFEGLHVLVAEDNAVNRKVAGKMLERLGVVDIVFAEDGEKAVEAENGSQFSLVLMDCDMPNMDGLQATRQIRAREGVNGNGRHVRIVAMTAHAMEGDRERCLDAGMDDYIQKPVTLDVLRRCLLAAMRAP